MSLRNNLLSIFILPSLLLIGCGGGGDFDLGNGDGDLGGDNATETEEEGSSTNTSTVSYLPLSIYNKYSAYVPGLDEDNVFTSQRSFPFINGYLINPINASTLLPVNNATVDDYSMKIDDIEIDPTESFPLLQKVIGNPIELKTAIVFDMTGSTNDVDLAALQLEAKSYVAKAQAHSNAAIKNQKFVVWSFGNDDPTAEDVVDLTGGFTTVSGDIEAAIDSLTMFPNASSNLHKAIVKAVGGYVDEDAGINYAEDGDNNLDEDMTSNRLVLSQIILFSSGPDSKRDFTQADMIEAIESQGLLKYDPADASVTDNFTTKPVFYYVLGKFEAGSAYSALSDVAENTTFLTLNSGSYSFGDTLISNQISAIDSRVDLDNQYLYRYAFLPRQGDHVRLFESRSSGFNYALTGDTNFESPIALGTPSYELESSVEITGPNGEFLSGAITGIPENLDGTYVIGGKASLADVSTFRAATRWTNEVFEISDYTWTLTGGSGVANSDGSYTVNSISGATATLQVDNTANGEMAFIEITN